MSDLDMVSDGGWGPLFLYLHSAVILFLLQTRSLLPIQSDRFIILIAAVIPPAVVLFLATVFNDLLIEAFVGEEIEQAYKEIDQRTGDQEFYYDADPDTKESINEMDEKAFKHLMTVLSGFVIAVSLPLGLYLFTDLYGGLGGVVGSALV